MFNVSKGRFAEFWNRVNTNDPANSALILVPLSVTDTEANRRDDASLNAFLAAAPNELTGNGWTRGTLTDANIGAWAPDNGNDRGAGTIPSFTWTAPTVGTAVGLAICYDSDTTSGTDANILPISHHDFSVVSDGNDVTLNAGTVVYAS